MSIALRTLFLALTLVASSCAGCDDESGSDFFGPLEFGEYEFDPQPDIEAPTVLDFGRVPAGEGATRRLTVRNVGRLELRVHDVSLTGPGFSRMDEVGREWTVESRDGRILELAYDAASNAPARGELVIRSNDPDEAEHRVVLIANRTTPCVGRLGVDAPVWEVHDGEGPMCFGEDSPAHGHEAEYEYATVPPPDDPGWEAVPDDDIEFERRSTLCGFECDCRDGGDFTYFQTTLLVPDGADVRRYHVEIDDVDDGARVTVFNDRHPAGITDPGAYARLFGMQADADLAPYFEPGLNRIVITQVDDCCSISRLRGVTIHADDLVVERCN